MRQYLLPKNGKFYKANMHIHTTVSDGKMTVEEVKAFYKENGYSIVAFTDHEVLVPHNDLADEEFLPITSYEISLDDGWPGGYQYIKYYHLNLYAKDRDATVSSVFSDRSIWLEHSRKYISKECAKVQYERHYSIEGMNDIIRKANEDGFLVCYNHQVWSRQRYPDYAGLKGLWGVEVFNSGCYGDGCVQNTQVFDDLLHENENVFPVAADDAHSVTACGYGWIQVKAEQLEYNTIMRALERGEFYASTGPEIYELYIEDGVVHLSTSDVTTVFLCTERRYSKVKRGCEEEPINEAAFDISSYIEECKKNACTRYRPWFRLEVFDKYGKSAQTRAYYVEEQNVISC